MIKNVLLLILISASLAWGQTNKQDSTWLPLKHFIGNWKGNGTGESGPGRYERSYQFILNNSFIEIRNKSTYPPNDKHPKGEVHEDLGYFIYDRNKHTFLLRQFHVEGFVNDYVLDSISQDKKTLVFATSAIVNIPDGWQAKETYRLLSHNEFEEIFELAPPGKPFYIYSRVKLVRQ